MASEEILLDTIHLRSLTDLSDLTCPDETQETDDYVAVVAIDIGTTFSGYAFSTKHKPENVRVNRNWAAERGFASYKTPTCVLFDGDGEFKSFGYDAQEEHSFLSTEESMEYFYFDRFKMLLHDNSVKL